MNATTSEPIGLTTFLNAYIEAALWSSTDESDERGGAPMDANYKAKDIAPEALGAMRADCAAFLSMDAAREDDIGTDWERAGHDFWLTRNGHGAGFWDGDWPEQSGKRLTALSKTFGESNLYIGDDGRVYVS